MPKVREDLIYAYLFRDEILYPDEELVKTFQDLMSPESYWEIRQQIDSKVQGLTIVEPDNGKVFNRKDFN